MRHPLARRLFLVSCAFLVARAHADTASWFHSCQVATPVSSGLTSDTVRSQGYLFTYTRDKLFSGGTGHPIGRQVRVPWPAGVEAQAVTTPPPGVTDRHARITLRRVDGQPFDLTAFTAELLANTAGAGGSIEIMPMLGGQDGFADPLPFDATGYYGQRFHYDTSPNPWGSTALLHGFDTYDIALYVDFAFVGLVLNTTAADPQSCCLPGFICADLTGDACAQQGGVPSGPGTSCSCTACLGPPGPAPAPDGRQGTQPLRAALLPTGTDIVEVTWDTTSCTAADYNLLYGDLNQVSSYALSGSVCSLGTNGTYQWTPVPGGDLYYLIVGTDAAGTESSWGLDGAGRERNGAMPSGACGVTVKNASQPCP